jgi:hypothetical protein
MELAASPNPNLPPRSWAAVVPQGSASVTLHHGSGIDVLDDAFVEGAWAGEFEDLGFRSEFLIGSAGALEGDRVVFCSPDHNLEKLTVITTDRGTTVSNSFAFALAASDTELDPGYRTYRNAFESFKHGTRRAQRVLPLRGGTARLAYCDDVSVGAGGIEVRERAVGRRDFSSFEDYVGYLRSTFERLVANASSPARTDRFSPLATVSSGFDSAACAALARSLGCVDACTIVRRDEEGNLVDHGGQIVSALGMTLHEIDRLAYLESSVALEPEFLGSGYAAQDITMAGLEPLVEGRLVVTGIHGDAVWSLERRPDLDQLRRGDSAGATFAEFRFRTNWLHLPLPFVGARGVASLRAISASEAMEPWRRGGHYDRPIPRRILQEAGVSPDLFGQEKHGYVGKLRTGTSLTVSFSPAVAEEFRRFVAGTAHRDPSSLERFARPLRRIDAARRARPGKVSRAVAPLIDAAASRLLGGPADHTLNSRYDQGALATIWGIEYMRDRYRRQLEVVGSAS